MELSSGRMASLSLTPGLPESLLLGLQALLLTPDRLLFDLILEENEQQEF